MSCANPVTNYIRIVHFLTSVHAKASYGTSAIKFKENWFGIRLGSTSTASVAPGSTTAHSLTCSLASQLTQLCSVCEYY